MKDPGTEPKHAEQPIRAGVERDAFRVRLTDALRALEDLIAVEEEAARILAKELHVAHALYGEMDPDGEHIMIQSDYANGVPNVTGRYRISDFGSFLLDEFRAGRTVVAPDGAADPRLSEAQRKRYASVGVRAFVSVPLMKNGRFVGILSVNHVDPRNWTNEEIELIEEVAERTWAAVERAKAEAALRASEQRLRALVEATSDVVYSMNADWSEMRKLSGGDFLKDTYAADHNWLTHYIPNDEQSRVVAAITEAIRTKSVFELEHRVRCVDGSVGWTFSRAVPILDDSGEVAEWFGAASDVTARKRAEEAVRESEARLKKAISIETVGVLIFSLDGRMVDANTAFERMSGYSREELRSTVHWEKLTAPEFMEVTRRTAQNLAEKGETPPYEKVMLRKDGSRWWGLFAPTRLGGSGGEAECLEFIIDITERKRAEDALRESVRRKNEFLAMLAHELRNPLGPIRNAVEILKRNPDSDPQLAATRRIIERQVNHLVRLVDDLLEVSRITGGKLQLRREHVVLQDIIEEAVETTRPHIGHNLHMSLPKDRIHLEADPTRLVQLFSNLLNNACRYTPRGGNISIMAQQEESVVVVTVRDDGIGIPQQYLPLVFDMFTQVDSSSRRGQGGLGIGLSLAKGIAELHDGRIEARSEGPGKGSEFLVQLPIVPAAAAGAIETREHGEREAVTARRILVVDDNEDNAKSMAAVLQLDGNEVETAFDGDEAIDRAAAWRPDVVLLDIGLPRKNGYEVCRAIRAQSWARNTIIIAVTGWGQDEDRRKSSEAGFDGHLVKPVSQDALLRMLATVRETSEH
ncbi:MAG: PAS domain S-box protein [Rhodospirillaceae bacterium]